MNVMVSLSNTPMAHPPRSNPFLRSSSVAWPFPCITPSTVTCVMVVSFMVAVPFSSVLVVVRSDRAAPISSVVARTVPQSLAHLLPPSIRVPAMVLRDGWRGIHRKVDRVGRVLRGPSDTCSASFARHRRARLPRTSLLRGSVNRGNRLDPTPHSCFVAQVLFAELPLQIPLLALDDATLDHQQRNRQKKDGPQRVGEASDARVDHRHGEVTGVAGVTKGSFRGYALDRLVG